MASCGFWPGLLIWTASLVQQCSPRLTFPSETAQGFQFVLSNATSRANEKWSWKALEQPLTETSNRNGGWKWMTGEKHMTMRFPSPSTPQVASSTESRTIKWPATTALKKSLVVRLPTNATRVLRYAPGYDFNPIDQPQAYPQYFTPRIQDAGSSSSIVAQDYGWVAVPGNMPLSPDVYPKHLYYGRGYPRESSKRFSLEIHPAYLVAPLAGLATFGLVSKLVKTPVLLELGLLDKNQENNNGGWNTNLHQHQHQHEHNHKPGVVQFVPIPLGSYPVASSTASASAISSATSNSQSVTQIPIILGNHNPSTGIGSNPTDNKPWWSPFAAMIPRLRSSDEEEEAGQNNDLERERRRRRRRRRSLTADMDLILYY